MDDADLAKLDPTLFDFDAGRRAQKRKFGGEFIPSTFPAGPNGELTLDFMQKDRNGQPKGIVVIKLEVLP